MLTRPSAGTSRSMRSNRPGRTMPEKALRSALHTDGYRFRVGYPVPSVARRSIDIAFPRWRLAVFVDGCFWHGCPVHATRPSRNSDYWIPKLNRNIERDRDTDRRLQDQGWTVLRIWEHETVAEAHGMVVAALSSLGKGSRL